jgi:hypothetical protein
MSKVLTITLIFNLIGKTNISKILRFTGDLDVFANFFVEKSDHFVRRFNKLCEKLIRSTLRWRLAALHAR